MNKHKGFTLLEVSIVLAITAILALGILPDLGNYTAKQELKLSASELTNYIQSARNYSATTECESVVSFQPKQGEIYVTITLVQDPQWRGCKRWFEASGTVATTPSNTQNTPQAIVKDGTVHKAKLAQAVNISFNGVSGNIEGNKIQTLVLSNDRAKGRIELSGIGNGVFEYD
jgi:prepilin-type N-terminal cleavage/methylation domain-containing protein